MLRTSSEKAFGASLAPTEPACGTKRRRFSSIGTRRVLASPAASRSGRSPIETKGSATPNLSSPSRGCDERLVLCASGCNTDASDAHRGARAERRYHARQAEQNAKLALSSCTVSKKGAVLVPEPSIHCDTTNIASSHAARDCVSLRLHFTHTDVTMHSLASECNVSSRYVGMTIAEEAAGMEELYDVCGSARS